MAALTGAGSAPGAPRASLHRAFPYRLWLLTGHGPGNPRGRQRGRVVLWHMLGGPSDREGAHNVEAAMVPGWVGTSLVRTFQVDSSGQSILTRQVPGETDVLVCGAWWTMRPDGAPEVGSNVAISCRKSSQAAKACECSSTVTAFASSPQNRRSPPFPYSARLRATSHSASSSSRRAKRAAAWCPG